jgi:hypothetical protein
MRIFLLCITLSISLISESQVLNALDFDGSNDYVTVPNASGILVGQTAWSMSCWAYLTNSAPSYPNFDGIIGIRNESNCDFFLLHLSSTKIEARFRNSLGTAYTITANNAVYLNSWTHYALVYTGNSLKFYVNGLMTDSISASGSINQSAVPFEIGRTAFQSSPFMLDGKVDEATLWSKALTHSEVSCLYQGNVDPSSIDLELYYDFNEGAPGQSNTGITTLPNQASNTFHGTLNGFGLTGNNSNWVGGLQNASIDSIEICYEGVDSIYGLVVDSAGIYPVYISSSSTCDSLVYYIVNEKDSIDTQVMVTLGIPPTLGALSGYDTYQWLICESNGQFTAISGETSPNFQPSSNGNYAVAIGYDGCTDTSHCVQVTGIGLNEVDGQMVRLYPNPAEKYISLSPGLHEVEYHLLDLSGRVIQNGVLRGNRIYINDLSAGTYVLLIPEKTVVIRFSKN